MRLNDARGSMPFALIAVAILLVSVAAGAVTAEYHRSERSAESAEREIDSIDDAIDDVAAYVNSGIGGIVRSVSVDRDLGGLESRADAFSDRMEEWISIQFSSGMTSHGARVTHLGHDVSLASVPADMASATGMDGCSRAYLKAVGTLDIRVETGSGSSETSLTVYSDGSYALPLAVERSELLESMASGNGAVLAQMMSHQLTALAEYRVANGYGGTSAYGPAGTYSVITADDAEEALRTSMDAIAAICFRDGDLATRSSADLADMTASEDGGISIDLSAVYAQALVSAADDLALRWLDYLCAFDIAEDIAEDLMPWRDAVDSLKRYLQGERGYSGVPYLKDAMSGFGYDEDSYRYPGSGYGAVTISVSGLIVTATAPKVDLFEQPWLTSFKRDYDSEERSGYIERAVLSAINAAAASIAERKDLGAVSSSVDPYDDVGFMQSLRDLYAEAATGGAEVLKGTVSSAISSSSVRDEFYGALAAEIRGHASELSDPSGLRDGIRSALESAIASEEGYDGPGIDGLMASDEVAEALASYSRAVRSDLGVFDGLDDMEASEDGLIKRILRWGCENWLGILEPASEKASRMMDGILGLDGTDPCSMIGLPGTDSFRLSTGSDGTSVERLSVEMDLGSVVSDASVGEGVHTVGFGSDPDAAYSTTFHVSSSGIARYTVTGSGALSEAMGTASSAYSGWLTVDTVIDVPVASGWALKGVDYEASDTLWTDLEDLLLEIFEPLIAPLMLMLDSMRRVLMELESVLVQAAGFAGDVVLSIYNDFIGPIERMNDLIAGYAEQAVSDTVMNVLIGIGLGDQTVVLEAYGCTLELATSAMTWAASTKTVMSALLTMPIGKYTVTAGFDVKVKGDWEDRNLVITGNGSISADGWSVKATADPLMKGGKYLFTVSGKVGKNRLSIVAPKLEDYNELGLTLSDVPGIGGILSNIPVPALGAKVGLDAGFQIRCKAPSEEGVLINEYESNPEGNDRGNEWVELYNNTDSAVDLSGWTLSVKATGKSRSMSLQGELAPGELMVVRPEFTLVNGSTDRLILADQAGSVSDEVRMKKDSLDDDMSWQRRYDGATSWEQKASTMGETNGTFVTSQFAVDDLKDCAWSAVQKAFGKVERITDLETLTAFMQHLVRYTLEELIDLVSGLIIDASVFVSADLRDAASAASTGIRLALRTDGDLAKDCLRYIAGQVESLALGMRNPYSIDPLEMFAENIDLEVLYHTGIGFPKVLSGAEDLPGMDLGVVFRANLSSLTRIIGADTGDPEIEFGVLARDCPAAAVPKRLSPKGDMTHDLWLFKGTLVLERCGRNGSASFIGGTR